MTLYEADWGRYAYHRDYGDGRTVLRDIDRQGAYVIVDAEKLAREYREVPDPPPPQPETPMHGNDEPKKNVRGKKTKAAAAAGALDLFAQPVDPGAAPIPLEVLPPPVAKEVQHAAQGGAVHAPAGSDRHDADHDDRPAGPPRCWVGPPLTLGAVPPGRSLVSLPSRLLQYWQPCALPIDGGTGGPHAYFIADNLAPSIYCDDCHDNRPVARARALAEAASLRPIPADHPRAITWALWSWNVHGGSRDIDPHGSRVEGAARSSVPEICPPSREPPLSRPLGLPPWEDDVDGKPIWERVGGNRGAALQEWFVERSAIMEHCGQMTREEADYRAYGNLIATARRHGLA